MEMLWKAVVAVFAAAGGAGTVFLFIRWAGSLMADHYFERKKADHQADLDRRGSAFKAELDAEADRLRHDLQREMLKASLSTTKVHVVYPRLFEKLRRAEGAVGHLWGGRYEPSYEGWDAEDFDRHLKEDLRLPGAIRAALLAELAGDRQRGIERLEEVRSRAQLSQARRRLTDVMNYIALKSVYLSDPVKKAALAAHETLSHALIGIGIFQRPGAENAPGSEKRFEDIQAALNAAPAKLNDLEELMRAELYPSGAMP